MKSLIITSPGQFEIREVQKPEISDYQALIKTEMVALCNATDRKLIEGHFPGQSDYPMALGHENVGIVEAIGSKVKNFKVGDRVIGGLNATFAEPDIHSGWGGFSEYVVANDFEVLKENGLATPEHGCWDSFEIQNAIPEGIGQEEGVIACTWREVLGAFKDFNLEPDKKVIIFGAGPVGLSFVKLGKLFGIKHIDIVDIFPEKLEIAKKMGADNTYTSAEAESADFINNANHSYDTVIDAVGLESIVNLGLSLIKMSGDICVYGVMTKNPLIDLSRGPYNFNLHMHQWPTRSEEKAAMTTLAGWIKKGELNAAEFISHRFNISQLQNALDAVKNGEAIKIIFNY